MIKIGDVWDSTTAVLGGRAGVLLPIAALAFLLPAALQAALTAYLPKSPAVAALGALLALAALAATVWGQLATVAVASDPDVTRADAGAAATRRLPAALLVTLVLIAGALVAVLPMVVALAASGFDFRAAAAGGGGAGGAPRSPGTALFLFFYGLVLFAGVLWLFARLVPLNPVVLHERRGIGAFGRSLALTRGLSWKLVGVLLLLGVALLVTSFAAQSVVFIVVRLILGEANAATAAFLGAVAAAIVTAAFTVVASVFAARLYAAIGAAAPPTPAP